MDDIESINLLKLLGLGKGGTGHSGELAIEAEKVLERDGGESHGLLLDLDALFSLDGLVEPLIIAAALHEAAGMLVDDDDLAGISHNIIFVTLKDDLSS